MKTHPVAAVCDRSLLFALVLILGISRAPAQSSVGINARIYGLTNSVGWLANTNASLTILGSMTTNITSNPFPIYKDRGFWFQNTIQGTDATTAAVTFQFDFSRATNGPWSTTEPLRSASALNGTNAAITGTNVSKAVADNVYWCRLSAIANAHTNSVKVILGDTNTFISVYP